MGNICLTIDSVVVHAQTLGTPTSRKIASCLPIMSSIHVWGGELYCGTNIITDLEADARDIIEAGELAFWVQGQSIIIGIGPTPLSKKDEIRLAAKSNVWAKVVDDFQPLHNIRNLSPISIELV